MDDSGFFMALSKALTKVKPRRPAEKYNSIRFLISALDGLKMLDGLTQDDLCDIFINELDLYPHGGSDPYAGFKKLVQKIRSQGKR